MHFPYYFSCEGVGIMPEMRIHESGGIVFVPTKGELELQNLKRDLKDELEEARKLTKELRGLLDKHKGGG
jgi:hypothetical protein